MRAVVKVAYFDNSGLHRAGEVVEVEKLNPYLVATEEKKVEEPTERTVEVRIEKATKKATKKTTKKTKRV